jgi:hypothetical protein
MIKLNTPTHDFEKSNIGDKKENTNVLGIKKNEDLIVQVSHGCEQLHKPFKSFK